PTDARRARGGHRHCRAAYRHHRSGPVYSACSSGAARRCGGHDDADRGAAVRARSAAALSRSAGGTLIYPIRYYGDPILRRRASPVTTFDADLERLAADMLETMYAADGIGIAAPQIGVPLRLFVALEVTSDEDDPEDVDDGSTLERAGHDGPAADVPLTPDVALTPDVPLTPDEKRRAWGVVREHVIVNPV